ncbi:MAG TPA: tetratricopeptide repeat protein [Longimicrobiales bacterium]|nr:tetratricopeptide repeat protein [Longimicrobiales bacterium]
MRRSIVPLFAAVVVACQPDVPAESPSQAAVTRPPGVEAISFLGENLSPPRLPAEVRSVYEANLAEAQAAYHAAPEDADAIIWLGRRTAYLGHFREAIEIFTRGISLHPDDARMYRHRGHRYISVRELDSAIEDLTEAVRLIEGTEDEVEPDGLPNAAGIPTSTLHFNIWYHLGLAHYLKGEFEQALLAWQACMAVSRHDDSKVATAYWLNNTMRRLGLDARAEELLSGVNEDMDVIESGGYLDVLLLHKGERTAEDLLGPSGDEATLESTTAGYGVAMWHFVNGRREEAYALMERVLTNRDQWAAFGYLAAEADLARAGQ